MGMFLSKNVTNAHLVDAGSQQRLADEILQQCNSSSNVRMIGLEGEWGSGKSTIIEMMKNGISTESNEEKGKNAAKTKVFVYDVWAHQEDPLRISILKNLVNELKDWNWLKDPSDAEEKKIEDENKTWEQKLDDLTKTKTEQNQIPKISWGVIGILIIVLFKDFIGPFFDAVLADHKYLHGFSVSLVPFGLATFFLLYVLKKNLNTKVLHFWSFLVFISMAFAVGTFAIYSFRFRIENIGYYFFALVLICVLIYACSVYGKLPGVKQAREKQKKEERHENNFSKLENELAKILSIYQSPTVENIEYTTTFSPMVDDFKDFVGAISKAIKDDNGVNSNNHLIIVFDNIDRMPCVKIQELWSFLQTVFVEKKYENITTVVTFDRKRICSAFDEPNQEGHVGDDYIDKTFDLVFYTPKMTKNQWENFFCDKWKEAFKEVFNEKASMQNEDVCLKVVLNTYSIVSKSLIYLQSRRAIISFINEWVSCRFFYISLKESTAPQEWSKWVYITLFVINRKKYLDSYSVVSSDDAFSLQFDNDVWNRLKSCYRVEENEFKDFISKQLCFETGVIKSETDYDRFKKILLYKDKITSEVYLSRCGDFSKGQIQDFLAFIDRYIGNFPNWDVIKRAIELIDNIGDNLLRYGNDKFSIASTARISESIRLKAIDFFEKNEPWPYKSYYLHVLAEKAGYDREDYAHSIDRVVSMVVEHYENTYEMFREKHFLWPYFIDDKIEISEIAYLHLFDCVDERFLALFKCDLDELLDYVEKQCEEIVKGTLDESSIDEFKLSEVYRLNWNKNQRERLNRIANSLKDTVLNQAISNAYLMDQDEGRLIEEDKEKDAAREYSLPEGNVSFLPLFRKIVGDERKRNSIPFYATFDSHNVSEQLRKELNMVCRPHFQKHLKKIIALSQNCDNLDEKLTLFMEIKSLPKGAKQEDVLPLLGALVFQYPWKNGGPKAVENWALDLIYNKDSFERNRNILILGTSKMRWAQGFLSPIMNDENKSLYEKLRDEFTIAQSMDPMLFELMGHWILCYGNVLDKPECFNAILPTTLLDGNDEVKRILRENRLTIQRLAARCGEASKPFMDKFLTM